MTRTWELTSDEIMSFDKAATTSWMGRIMDHLFTMVQRAQYNKIALELVRASRRRLDELKRVLIKAVDLIKESRQKQSHLTLVTG